MTVVYVVPGLYVQVLVVEQEHRREPVQKVPVVPPFDTVLVNVSLSCHLKLFYLKWTSKSEKTPKQPNQ